MNAQTARERLLEVGLSHFARRGFEGTSTRTIAVDARTTLSAITYTFEGKAGLFKAVSRQVASALDTTVPPFSLACPIKGACAGETTTRILLAFDRLLSFFMSGKTPEVAVFALREIVLRTPERNSDVCAVLDRITAEIARALSVSDEDGDQEAGVLACLLVGQVIAARLMQEQACRMLPGSTAAVRAALKRATLTAIEASLLSTVHCPRARKSEPSETAPVAGKRGDRMLALHNVNETMSSSTANSRRGQQRSKSNGVKHRALES